MRMISNTLDVAGCTEGTYTHQAGRVEHQTAVALMLIMKCNNWLQNVAFCADTRGDALHRDVD